MEYYDNELTVHGLVRELFVAGSITWFLYAMHRLANGRMLSSRVKAYDTLADAYTAEEREVLIHKIKRGSVLR